MFENDILRNYSQIYLVSWGGFWAFGHPNDARTPRWLDYGTMLWILALFNNFFFIVTDE